MSNRFIALTILSISFPALATIELNENLSLSGFGSSSLARSNNDTPLIINRNISDENCWDCDTTFGIQLDYFNDDFKLSTQLVKRPQDNWSDPEFEWAYVGYSIENVELRAGRLRLPTFLASEYFYVNQAYNYARPPEELYNSILGITAYNGVSVVWDIELFDAYQLAVTPFISVSDSGSVNVSDTLDIDLDIKKLSGVNFLLTGDFYRWNLSYLTSDFAQKLKFTNAIPGVPYFELDVPNDSIELYSLGAEYEFDSLLITSERQIANLRSTWYISAAYRMDKFVPYVEYGENKAKVTKVSRFEGKSGSSFVMGLRYDLLYNVSINAEWQQFKSFDGQRGSFIESPKEPDADLYTLMLSFVF